MPGEASRINGRKGGRRKQQAVITKEAIRAIVQRRVVAELTPLLDAQIANAKGLKYLVVRAKATGKFLRVITEAQAKHPKTLTTKEEIVEVWDKQPSIQAFTDLLNRAADKPKEQEQDVNLEARIEYGWRTEE